MAGGEIAKRKGESRPPPSRPSARHAQWHWATPQTQLVLGAGNLAGILRFCRRVHGLNQTAFGDLLGYDKTYISALELGKRIIDDVGSRRRICEALPMVEQSPTATTVVAPQWRVIELITVADVQVLADDRSGAAKSLGTAIREALTQRLPPQLQRAMRTAGNRLPSQYATAAQSLDRIRSEMAA